MIKIIIIFAATVYLLATIQEWALHKYLMHSNTIPSLHNNHILHHKTTNADYSIEDNNPKYVCINIASVNGIIQLAIIYSINTSILYLMFSPMISYTVISWTIITMLSINIILWNQYHSYVHNVECDLLRIAVNEQNWYVNWLVSNHRMHHTNSKGNYNIVFPGGDYLFGTHNTTPQL